MLANAIYGKMRPYKGRSAKAVEALATQQTCAQIELVEQPDQEGPVAHHQHSNKSARHRAGKLLSNLVADQRRESNPNRQA